MAGTLKKVRFILAWQDFRVGAEILPNARLRDFLLGGGYAVIVDDENTARDQEVNRMVEPPMKRKPGRHRRAG